MDAFIYKLILLCCVSFTSTSVVKWLPNSSFNLPINFKDGKLPCSRKNVVFPQSISGSVEFQSAMEIGSLILPEDGEIILDNALISLGKDDAEKNCTDGYSYYLDNAKSGWMQVGAWSSSRFTEATPDTERLPCYYDDVEFPKDTKYTVILPDQKQYVRGLKIGNESYSTVTFFHYSILQSDEMQQFVFNQFYGIGVIIGSNTNCQNRDSCPCQPNTPKIDCSAKFCPKPSCVAPIKPTGYCCSFCGGYITFNVDEGFDMISFKELANKIIDGYGGRVVSHIGVVSTDPEHKVQLVIVDKTEYVGSSSEAVNTINNEIQDHWYKGVKLFQVSGSPLSKQGLGWKIFVSMFFVVVLVMSGLYLFYYKLPQVRIPGVGGGSGIFTRSHYRSDSVVSLTRRDSSVSAVLPSRMAFRNPLYDSKRGRVQVEQSVDEE